MNNDPKTLAEALLAKNRRPIDRSLRALSMEMEHENTLLADTPATHLNRVVKNYQRLKPLLTLVASLGLLPGNWRGALMVFTQALDALVLAAPSLTSPPVPEGYDFKAGKDL